MLTLNNLPITGRKVQVLMRELPFWCLGTKGQEINRK